MQKLRILVASALAGSLDLGLGALIAGTVLTLAGVQPALWHLAVGGVLAVLPDFDIVSDVLRTKEPAGNHRVSPMHRPLLVIPAASLVAYILGGNTWTLITFLCVLWHYLHDTPPLSKGGISWLWPFDHRYWSLSGLEDTHKVVMSHHEWLKTYWMRPTKLSITEVGIGLLAFTAALIIVLR